MFEKKFLDNLYKINDIEEPFDENIINIGLPIGDLADLLSTHLILNYTDDPAVRKTARDFFLNLNSLEDLEMTKKKKKNLSLQVQEMNLITNMTNNQLFYSVMVEAPGDDHDGEFTPQGKWKFELKLAELEYRLKDWLNQ